jgi:hypothetical protein
MKRLCYIIIAARHKPLYNIHILCLCRHKNNRHFRSLSDFHTCRYPVHPRHHNIQKNQRNMILRQHLKRPLCIVALYKPIPFTFQVNPQQVPDVFIIIYNKNIFILHLHTAPCPGYKF